MRAKIQAPPPPFYIEKESYTEWSALLRKNVKPQLMLCGHVHECYIDKVGCNVTLTSNLGEVLTDETIVFFS